MNFTNIPAKFLIWRIKHISNRNFIIILSGVIGCIAGLAAVVLKESVHFIELVLTRDFEIQYANYLYLSYPLAGILITVLLGRYLFRERSDHGITSILYAISRKSGIIRKTKMFSQMVTSAITVGFGGSVGLEAPIVVTGSAIGANTGQLMRMNYKKRTLLIGCGAAGAISGIFNSPIAGVIFSVEVILAEITIAAFIPLLIASVFGSITSLVLIGSDILFTFKIKDSFVAADTPYYILLGICCGLVGVYFVRTAYTVERAITKINSHWLKALTGGIGLGLVIFVFPPIYGEGYNTIKELLEGNVSEILNSSLFFPQTENFFFLMVFILGIILIKPVASALTVGVGGSGGMFAPTLFIGGMTGYLFARLNNFFGVDTISTSNFTLIGMCGVMSGVLHAPLTAIFLIAEITSGYTLFIPLMLVSAIAYSTFSYFEKHSFYTKKLIEAGDLIQHDKDRQVLYQINLKKIIETDLLAIHPEETLDDLVKLVRHSKRNIFPVIDENQTLAGIITLDDIREIMFDSESRKSIIIKTLMHNPPERVSSKETMQSVMRKFEKTGAWNLPVIDDGKYTGFVSKSRIFNAYRQKLLLQQKE